MTQELLQRHQIHPGIEELAGKGVAQRMHRESPLQSGARGIHPEMAWHPAMIERPPPGVVEELGRGLRPPAPQPVPQCLLGVGAEVCYPPAAILMPLMDHELLALQLDIQHLQRHQFAQPNPAAQQQQKDRPLQVLIQGGEEALNLRIAQRARERLRLHQIVMRANGGNGQLFLADKVGIKTVHTAQHGVDGTGLEASCLEGVEEALDMGALYLQQAGWSVAIPAVHKGFQRPAVGLHGDQLTIAASDRFQPADHEGLIRCRQAAQLRLYKLGD
jgi:hypothetical protein